MKKDILSKLRERLDSLYESASGDARDKAFGALAPIGRSLNENAAFNAAWNMTWDALEALLAPSPKPLALSEDYLDHLADVLTFRYIVRCENWAVRPDVTDAELLGNAEAIRNGDVDRLDDLRDGSSTVLLYSGDLKPYHQFLGNVRYLLDVLAHEAKHLRAPAAGHEFLYAASLLAKLDAMPFPQCDESRRTALIDHIRRGLEERAIALDYAALEPWTTYRRREYSRRRDEFAQRREDSADSGKAR